MMKIYFLQGFLLGLAYVAPIGTQNIYVINTAIREKFTRAMLTALLTVFFDITLALACFWGIGLLVEEYILARRIILALGCITVIYIGFKLIMSAPAELKQKARHNSILSTAAACFIVTWLNPQAIIDGSLLLGGIYATLPSEMYMFFILGVCCASFIWFTGLAGIMSYFKGNFNYKTLKVLNIICGIIIVYYGLKLGYSFITTVATF